MGRMASGLAGIGVLRLRKSVRQAHAYAALRMTRVREMRTGQNLQSKIFNQKSSIKNLQSKIFNQKSSIKNLQSEIS
jgi:hypothetical protein